MKNDDASRPRANGRARLIAAGAALALLAPGCAERLTSVNRIEPSYVAPATRTLPPAEHASGPLFLDPLVGRQLTAVTGTPDGE